MKKLIAFALCALFSIHSAEARTLYVDASRPNNNGNGLKLTTAKKTLQAAINIAKNGDTILVYPGTYAPITTKNKKIKIKSKSGNAKTTILHSGSADTIAKLGATWKIKYSWKGYRDSTGSWVPAGSSSYSSNPLTKGSKTSLTGFTLDGNDFSYVIGISGGTVQSCVLQNVGSYNGLVSHANLVDCTIQRNILLQIDDSTINRCKIIDNSSESYESSESSKFANTLFAGNSTTTFTSCTFVNCTVANNQAFKLVKSTACNTIFSGVAAANFKANKKNTLKNCYKGSNPKFVDDGDYRLAKGSPCINKGKLTKTQKKLVGSKDLAGKKRIKGKSIDIGCYEY